jgi:hypothetical protein
MVARLVEVGQLLGHQDLPILIPLIFIFGVISSLWFMKRRKTTEMHYFKEYWMLHSKYSTLWTFLRRPSIPFHNALRGVLLLIEHSLNIYCKFKP